jgi:UDP-glucose 4-epimerase
MKALITGGAGFIGSHLSEYLLSTGDLVIVLDNLSTGRLENIAHLQDNPDFSFVEGTITDQELMDKLIGQSDIVFHLAAAVGVQLIIQSPVNTIETNVFGTEVILRAAQRHQTKVVLASTSEVYGKRTKTPFSEDDDRLLGPTTKSRWSYAASKALDEYLALAYYHERNLPVVICRLFNTVGARQTGRYGMVIPRFVKQALTNQPLTVYGDGTQTRCFCDVADVVRAMATLAETSQAEGDVFNIGNTEEVTITELAQRIILHTKSRSPIQYISYEEAYEPGFEDMQRRVPDINKITRLINWRPTYSLDQLLKRLIASHQDRS